MAFCGLYFGVCQSILWYHARSMVVPYCYQCAPGPPPAILSIAIAYTSHLGANAEGRMQNEERPGEGVYSGIRVSGQKRG